MRIARLLLVFVCLVAGAADLPAATTAALDPLVAAVLDRRTEMDPPSPRERRTYNALGRVAHELATPAATLSDELGVAAAVIRRLRRSLKAEVQLRSTASEALDNLDDTARDERDRLQLWKGQVGDAAREAQLTSALDETDRFFRQAGAMKREAARARLLARGCSSIDRARSELGLVGDPPVMPDFSIPDVNPASTTYGTNVSPRDYEDKISAWYFGKAG